MSEKAFEKLLERLIDDAICYGDCSKDKLSAILMEAVITLKIS